jgi:hypothetical protein
MSIFSVSNFQGVIDNRGGLSRPNRFVVHIHPPHGLDGGVLKDLHILCESASFPTRSLATADQKMYGPIRKIARESIYADLALNFVVPADYSVKHFFDRWQNLAQNDREYDPSYYDTYIGDITLYAMRETDTNLPGNESSEAPYSIQLEECFPMQVGDIAMSSSDTAYGKLQITFAYRRWFNRKIHKEI